MSRRQLLDIGVGSSAIGRAVKHGRLHAVHRGVYAVGHPRLTSDGRLLAAVLAAGAGAALSHVTAAAHLGLIPSASAAIHVTAPRGGPDSGSASTLHTTRSPLPIAACDGIPTTTVARTLLDLAATIPPAKLQRAIEQAERLRLFDLSAIAAQIAGARGHHGITRLAKAVGSFTEPPPLTRSEAERALYDLVTAAGLPRPACNANVAGMEVDLLWEDRGTVVEVDGFDFHRTQSARERDHLRDAMLSLAGYRRVQRFTARQIARDPQAVVGLIADLLRE